jgi:hypothetical protein
LTDESHFLLLVLLGQRIPRPVRAEATLWADGYALERLLARLAAALGDKVSGLVDALLDFLLVLELPQLGADGANDNVLILGEELERLKATGTLRVILQVESVHLEVRKELLGIDIIGAFGKVSAADKVATAQVDARVKVGRQLADAIVVERNIRIRKVIYSTGVVRVLGPSLAKLVGAKV